MSFPLLQRIGVVLTLLLAALMLGADAGEYPGMTRAGMRALSRGAVPLVVVAGLNFLAIRGRRPVRVLAFAINVVFLAAMLRMSRSGAPPFVWIGTAVAALLVAASSEGLRGRRE